MEQQTSHNIGSQKLPLSFLEVENKLDANNLTLFKYSNYYQGVKDCYKLLERQLSGDPAVQPVP